MARRKQKKSSYPNPVNGFIDFCAGATMAIIAKSMLKKDIEKGEGNESLVAGSIVFGHRALRGDPVGIGGMLGLNSALHDTEKHSSSQAYEYQPQITGIQQPDSSTVIHTPPKYVWREYCSVTNGIDPQNYETADDFSDAVSQSYKDSIPEQAQEVCHNSLLGTASTNIDKRHIWRKYCPDGSPYGIDPDDYECADDYEDALRRAKERD